MVASSTGSGTKTAEEREAEEIEIRADLPQEPNSFIGRERELGELRELVGTTRALTLCGAGGIGKTRLALRLIGGVADGFPDGAWYVELGDLRQPDLVVSRVASVIGVSEEPGRPLLETLADALRPRRLLLALDNCEHLIDACARLCQRLLASSPGSRLIATSREPLRSRRDGLAGAAAVLPPLAYRRPRGPMQLRGDQAVRRAGAASLPGFTVGPGNAAP
jgi:predicted ATPase